MRGAGRAPRVGVAAKPAISRGNGAPRITCAAEGKEGDCWWWAQDVVVVGPAAWRSVLSLLLPHPRALARSLDLEEGCSPLNGRIGAAPFGKGSPKSAPHPELYARLVLVISIPGLPSPSPSARVPFRPRVGHRWPVLTFCPRASFGRLILPDSLWCLETLLHPLPINCGHFTLLISLNFLFGKKYLSF